MAFISEIFTSLKSVISLIPIEFILIYYFVISLVTVLFTVYDKRAAQKGERRISEKCLFSLAFLGGAVAEYITMKIIRHKTKHKSFMIGLPTVILVQVAATIILSINN